jgi:uncharacterized repeat protein (TIGR03843 family)
VPEPADRGPDDDGFEFLDDDLLDDDLDDDDLDDDLLDDDAADEGGDERAYVYDATVRPDDPAIVELLSSGSIEILGQMPWSSNATFLVEVHHGDDHAPAVYKPARGERPLWDFPDGLWQREVASYELSHHLGWAHVPPTVARHDAPLGPGSVQAFVPARYAEHYFTLQHDAGLTDTFRRLCAFDLVANSTDRKGGHVLIDDDDRIWAIDNGLTFHVEFKLRTVIWEFAGEPIGADVAEALAGLLDRGLPSSLDALLDRAERDATLTRAGALLAAGAFPHDPTGRRHPWPLV